jgi:hypothetical protein
MASGPSSTVRRKSTKLLAPSFLDRRLHSRWPVSTSEEPLVCNVSALPADVARDPLVGASSGSSIEVWQTMQIMERRKHRRLALHWRVRLSGETIGTIETLTENLNSRGFYCILETPLVPGDIIDCNLTVPNYSPANVGGIGSLVCQAEVVRVETRGTEPGFGVACRIVDFTVAPAQGHSRSGSFND